jgi:hypothetical protein
VSGAAGSTGATYPVTTMAKLLLMTERSVSGLALRGVVPKAERGRYELVPVVQAYIRYLRDRTIGGDMTGDDNLANAKGRMVKARARMAEAEADLLDGSLLRRAAVEAAWERVLVALRMRILALPAKAAPVMHAAPTLAEASALLTTAVHDALSELARLPVYATDVGGTGGPDPVREDDADDFEATAEVDDLAVG